MINSPQTLETWLNERGILCNGWTARSTGMVWRVSFKVTNHRSAMAIVEKLRMATAYTLQAGPAVDQYRFIVYFPVTPRT